MNSDRRETVVIERSSAPWRRSNLPADVTPFVGRRGEKSEIRRLLSASRMVTATGTGGVGKSRLALQAAREVHRAFGDGVWIVDLAQASGSTSVGAEVAATLGLSTERCKRAGDDVARRLQDRHLMLVFDNCDLAAEEVSRFASALLHVAPRAAVLATSRQALGIGGEHVLPVMPLSTPDPASMALHATTSGFDAPALFAHRAAAIVPDFTITPRNQAVVAQLCWQLDGLPLALELAAVRLNFLSVAQLVAGCDDRFALLSEGHRDAPARHRSLRACVELSYNSCSPQERLLWARLSMVPDSFDLEAAALVSAESGLDRSLLRDLIAGLVSKSVLYREEVTSGVSPFMARSTVRYRMLETIRAYGREKLVECGDRAWLTGSAEIVVCDRPTVQELSGGQPAAEGWHDIEGDGATDPNARTAASLASLATVSQAQPSVDREGVGLTRRRTMPVDAPHPQEIVTMLRHALALCLAGELDRADALCTECRMLSIGREDAWGLSYSSWISGLIRWQQRDYGEAVRHALASVHAGRHVHERLAVARAQELLAWIAASVGAHERAAELLGASAEAWRLVPSHLERFDWENEWRRHCEAQVRQSLGEDRFQAALQRGAEVRPSNRLKDDWEGLLPPSGTPQSAGRTAHQSPLTERQSEVAVLVAAGLSDREIADKLVVAQRTAEGHVANILARLGFASRAQIAAWVASNVSADSESAAQVDVGGNVLHRSLSHTSSATPHRSPRIAPRRSNSSG